jgi:hypothetical protein
MNGVELAEGEEKGKARHTAQVDGFELHRL